MKKKNKKLLLLFLPFVLLLSGCSTLLRNNQLQFGIQAAQKDLWDEAIFRWKKALEVNPQSAAAYNNLAVAYEKKGMWNEAGKAYEAAFKIAPQNKYVNSNYEKFKDRLESPEKETPEKKKNEKK